MFRRLSYCIWHRSSPDKAYCCMLVLSNCRQICAAPSPSPALRPECSPTPRFQCTRAAHWGMLLRRTGCSSTRLPRTTRKLQCEVRDGHFEPSNVWRQWWSTVMGYDMQLDLSRQNGIRNSSSLLPAAKQRRSMDHHSPPPFPPPGIKSFLG